MSDRPILFSAPMVRALLAGTKTQTRRVIKQQPPENVTSAGVISRSTEGQTDEWTWLSGDPRDIDTWECEGNFATRFRPGDRLWVKETWAVSSIFTDVAEIRYRASAGDGYTEMVEQVPVEKIANLHRWQPTWPKYRSPLFMQRCLSRITLDVTDVRVERLQDISDADAIAEGLVWKEPTDEDREWAKTGGDSGEPVDLEGVYTVPGARGVLKSDVWGCPPQQAYRFLWNAVNGPCAWDANPWVVAISFTAHRRNIDQEPSA